jgi:hypothetical protein
MTDTEEKKKKIRRQMDTRHEGPDHVIGVESSVYGPESIQRRRLIGPTSPNHRAKSHKRIRILLDE